MPANGNKILSPPSAAVTELNWICGLVFPLFLWIHFVLLIFLTLSLETALLLRLSQLWPPSRLLTPDFQFPFIAALYLACWHLLSLSPFPPSLSAQYELSVFQLDWTIKACLFICGRYEILKTIFPCFTLSKRFKELLKGLFFLYLLENKDKIVAFK